jgi:hypothetical protein
MPPQERFFHGQSDSQNVGSFQAKRIQKLFHFGGHKVDGFLVKYVFSAEIFVFS